ncbi:hypothetical protein F2Q69_00052164 [Brassica cretica]|uniref:Uncharacterized protein n=1 Tax=Brassica cretica TaxID=69181 RepID=A0A8S9MZL9_BRACR|nr:hypothetical protein F2Q69_00052164 [Brassica cretica]
MANQDRIIVLMANERDRLIVSFLSFILKSNVSCHVTIALFLNPLILLLHDGGVGTSSGLLNHAVSNAEKRPDSTLKKKTKNVNESAIAKDKLAPGSFHLGRSEGSSSRRVVDSSSREPLSGGSDYESALRGIDNMRIDNNAVNETAASSQSIGGDDSTPRIELKAKLSD